ncbi:2TM domain-containing protein [Clostridium tunisiense]|uniref:2TM domain-containing protein n=1 Tax=Clostridium tunisiense TaxID=219748 RepID=UPI0002EF6CDB|nr:2TM domain-containing protein [Clostridium tunisiense]
MYLRRESVRNRKGGTNKFKAWIKILFFIHLAAYIAVNGFLAFVNFFTWNGYLWFVWPLFSWGIGVMIHGVITLLAIYLCSSTQDGQSNYINK